MSLVRKKLSEITLTEQDKKKLKDLADKPDSEIDYSDIPPLPEDFFERGKVGVFYKPIKRSVTMELDADVLDWLRSGSADYQTRANQILRAAMIADLTETKPQTG